jgi:hypothetical protein
VSLFGCDADKENTEFRAHQDLQYFPILSEPVMLEVSIAAVTKVA